MRLKRAKVFTQIFLALLGIGMLVAALYAYELRLDNNRAMGNQRKALAVLGLGCLALSAGLTASRQIRAVGESHFIQSTVERFKQAARRLTDSRPALWMRKTGRNFRQSAMATLIQRHPGIWAGSGALLVILVSLWFITSGGWGWGSSSAYFDRQADAFLAGSLALLEKPSPELLALDDPYNYRSREEVGYLWDASLYQGNFYLYWGPVPALLATAVKLIRPGEVPDQQLLFFFATGLAATLAALLHWLRKTLFPGAPAWTVLLLILLGGLCAPVFWLINNPKVYETTIAAGEFFLLLGLYAALRGMAASSPARGWLAAAGLAWGAAVGCRANTVVAVGWLAGLVCLFLLLESKKGLGRAWVGQAVWLALPLLAWAAGLGWYNLARFGSILETGHRYQLTGPALPADYSYVISPAYIVPNLYNYLFRPLVLSWKKFPYLFAPTLNEQMWPWFIRLPKYFYAAESVAGIFLSIPAFWLALLPILRPLRSVWNWVSERPSEKEEAAHPLLPWAGWMVGGAMLCNLGSLLVFISSTMRYLADVAPLMTLLTGLSTWWGVDFLCRRPGARRWVLAAVVALCLLSVLIGLLVNLSSGSQRLEVRNPDLYWTIAHFFMGIRE